MLECKAFLLHQVGLSSRPTWYRGRTSLSRSTRQAGVNVTSQSYSHAEQNGHAVSARDRFSLRIP